MMSPEARFIESGIVSDSQVMPEPHNGPDFIHLKILTITRCVGFKNKRRMTNNSVFSKSPFFII